MSGRITRDHPVSGPLIEERIHESVDRRQLLQLTGRDAEERVLDTVDDPLGHQLPRRNLRVRQTEVPVHLGEVHLRQVHIREVYARNIHVRHVHRRNIHVRHIDGRDVHIRHVHAGHIHIRHVHAGHIHIRHVHAGHIHIRHVHAGHIHIGHDRRGPRIRRRGVCVRSAHSQAERAEAQRTGHRGRNRELLEVHHLLLRLASHDAHRRNGRIV
ncbi:hypothetical protein MSMEI_5209 [Mycolicibacterium smegmatis MC2 155]|uniref:Uncharacterized protein n=1 Tax=Mycolicibacterium smegmatis (strain ATCC 700084 / mc(2)155) TaxID=246196 RepID=I7FS43_MYCS2|nr:hypothetical protein MSMEI_5209 [Mycolicibacterium smegmatis MC2 155]